MQSKHQGGNTMMVTAAWQALQAQRHAAHADRCAAKAEAEGQRPLVVETLREHAERRRADARRILAGRAA